MSKDATLTNYFDQVFTGLPIAKTEKQQLLGIYLISLFKVMLELLLSLNGQDQAMLSETNRFFNAAIAKLNPEKKTLFSEAMEKQKLEIMKQLLQAVKDNIPADLQVKLQANLQQLSGSQPPAAP